MLFLVVADDDDELGVFGCGLYVAEVMVVAPFESFDLSIPGGSLVGDDESALPVTSLANDSVCTDVGFAGEFGSLSTGNSVIVPAARWGMSGAFRTGGVYVVFCQT